MSSTKRFTNPLKYKIESLENELSKYNNENTASPLIDKQQLPGIKQDNIIDINTILATSVSTDYIYKQSPTMGVYTGSNADLLTLGDVSRISINYSKYISAKTMQLR
ncbi:MAG: hypothetical protein J6J17_04380 [Bacilli bacterium]|nr:hypothetical protein [Bacilli bacterium]